MPKPSENGACCAHLTVEYRPIHNDNGTMTERWVCISCNHRFVPSCRVEKEKTFPIVEGIKPSEKRIDFFTLFEMSHACGHCTRWGKCAGTEEDREHCPV
ncbi:MAG: hypothetical protein ACYSUV_20665, partial [Planctomycetota bacterium]